MLPRTWKAYATQADTLLASLAFPRSRAAILEGTRGVEQLRKQRSALSAAVLRRGDDSGHDGTTSRHSFDLGVAEWLVSRHPHDVEIDWHNSATADALEALLRPVVQRAEEEGFDSDSLTLRAWVKLARGDAWPSDLAWLLDTLRSSGDALPRRVAAWEDAALPIVWRLRAAGALHARLSVARPVPRASFRATPKHAARTITKSLRQVRLLSVAEADAVIEVSREALAVRCREVHAISHANREEVYLADLGSGTSIAVIGVLHALRLSLEANYGFVLFANGVPVGYGGVSPLFRQANTGINIFAPFRGTEAGMLWVRALQAFHALFGSKRFIANPFQVGGGNTEALKSGAFWFYHRLGFRPSASALAALADHELAARQRDRSHRSSMAVLKQLAGADLVLTLPGFSARDAFDERWLARIALRATGSVAAEGQLSRPVALRRIAKRVAASLGLPRKVSASEREAFDRLAPVAAAIPDLKRWTKAKRRALAQIMLAKGRPQERDFVHAASASRVFFDALSALATTHPAK